MANESDLKVIADYVTGLRRVRREELATALQNVNNDVACRKRLREALGLPSEWLRECAAVQSRLDELADCSEEAIEKRFPSFHRHLEVCVGCHEALSLARPVWVPTENLAATVVSPTVQPVRQRLADSIRVFALECRQLFQGGLGVLARAIEPEAAMMDASIGGTCAKLEWALADDTSGTDIRVTASPRPDAQPGAALTFALETREGQISEARISVRVRSTGELVLSKELVPGADAVSLKPGVYSIVLEDRSPEASTRNRSWELPIEILSED